jgi:hypothetical protein
MKQAKHSTLRATPWLTCTTSVTASNTSTLHFAWRRDDRFLYTRLPVGWEIVPDPNSRRQHRVTASLLNLDTAVFGIAVWFIHEVHSRPGLFVIHRWFEPTTDSSQKQSQLMVFNRNTFESCTNIRTQNETKNLNWIIVLMYLFW